MNQTAAGWYPVPGGQQYWDGEQWVGEVAPAPQSSSDNTWCIMAHLATFLSSILGPLVVWLIKKDQSPDVRHHAAQSFNFDVTVLLSILGLVVVLVIGVVTRLWPISVIAGLAMVVVAIGNIVFKIIAAIAAGRGERYEYPYALTFLK